MDYIIRLMTIDDKEEVINMMEVFYNSDAVLTNGSKEIFENDFSNCVNDSPFLQGFIFEVDKKIIGYAMIAKTFSTEYGLPCVFVEDLYLKEQYRKKGIGSSFFKYIEEKYPNTIFKLEVEKDNFKAQNMYKKNGYDTLDYMEMKKINR